jgi:capsular polysaccharide biosynthesis protein
MGELDRIGDAWYESEERTRAGMVAELRRIRQRVRARPLSVLALAAVLTGAIVYKIATRAPVVEAEIVLALTQGTMSAEKRDTIPYDDLRQYVDGVLIPDAKLRVLIERRDLYPLRHRLGMEYAIGELRSQMDIQIWKNSFVYYDADAERAEHSARIGITVADTNPDRAYQLASDLAAIVIETAQEERLKLNTQLAQQIASAHKLLAQRLESLTSSTAKRRAALEDAQEKHLEDTVQVLSLEVAELEREQKQAERKLSDIANSRDALADRIAAAGLDTHFGIVEEHRPERSEHREFVLAMIAVVIAVCSLIGSALLIGAFDSRVHDTDDVARLGLPVLGHVPGFAGDEVGSLRARGATRARVPSSRRWRSHR